MLLTALELARLGYTDLVSVIPPGAELSPRSTIALASRGKVPGLRGVDGWHGYGWQDHDVALGELERTRANIGLRARHFPGLDLDVQSASLRDMVMRIAHEVLGSAPVRRSVEPRALLMYATAQPFPRMTLTVEHAGRHHLIEWLCDGRQYLIAGTHPSGAPYRWDAALPPAAELTVIDHARATAFFDEIQERLGRAGLSVYRYGRRDADTAMPKSPEALAAPSMEALRDLVRHIPNPAHAGWDDMVQIGYAIRAAGGEEAFPIFAEWCSRWQRQPHDPDTDRRNWESFGGPYRIGWTWLTDLAEALGEYDSARQEFRDAGPVVVPADELRRVQVDGHTDDAGVPTDFTDAGIAHWVLPQVESSLRYIAANRCWYVWSDWRWVPDQSLRHEALLATLLRKVQVRLKDRAESAASKGERATYEQQARVLGSTSKLLAVIAQLRSRLPAQPTSFDVDPWLLNTPGGVVDLSTGVMHATDPSSMLSRSTLVTPVPGDAPLWHCFLRDCTDDDTELQQYLQRVLGYMLTGDMREKTLWYAWGSESDTGKSTLIRTVTQLLGSYADTVSPNVFLRSHAERIPAELARMPGVRLVTSTEPEHGRAWDETRIKAITGGDGIEVRFLYGQPFVFQPQFKILIVGNSEPEIRNIDDAILRRIQIVPLNHPVPRERQVADLSQRMVDTEGARILQWMIDGCRLWRQHGLHPPPSVQHSTQEYAEEEDLLGQWIAEECELGEGLHVSRAVLHASFSTWCRMRGETVGGLKTFRRAMRPALRRLRLRETQVGPRKQRGYAGIGLRFAHGAEDFHPDTGGSA